MRLPTLLKGDKCFVCSPSYEPNPEILASGFKILESWGLKVLWSGPGSPFPPFAAPDEDRFSELQSALDNADAKVIFCARGGYGLTRYIDQLDWTCFEENPKWVIGFSDITALHLALQQRGFASIHGPMLVHLAHPDHALAVIQLDEILFRKRTSISYSIQAESIEMESEIRGQLVGGNLTLLVNSLATKSEISTDDKILFLEEVGERFYRLDRMLQHLLRAGKLTKLKAVVLGQFTDCELDKFPYSIAEMVTQKTGSQIPVFSGLKAGHGKPTYPIVLGAEAILHKSASGFTFTQNIQQLV